MKIQRDLATLAADLPALINVRIGLSAGEPVERPEDLFGSAVNLASQACDKPDAGQILIASVVRDLCIGKQYDFPSEGLQALRGFEDPVQLSRSTGRTSHVGLGRCVRGLGASPASNENVYSPRPAMHRSGRRGCT